MRFGKRHRESLALNDRADRVAWGTGHGDAESMGAEEGVRSKGMPETGDGSKITGKDK